MWLWFMPWRQFSIEAFDFNQTGSHMGGVAYMLLMSSFAYAVLAWLPNLFLASLWRPLRHFSQGSSG
jgi:hypothetical protein